MKGAARLTRARREGYVPPCVDIYLDHEPWTFAAMPEPTRIVIETSDSIARLDLRVLYRLPVQLNGYAALSAKRFDALLERIEHVDPTWLLAMRGWLDGSHVDFARIKSGDGEWYSLNDEV